MITYGKTLSIIGIIFEAIALYILYNQLPTTEEKINEKQLEHILEGPVYEDDSDTKEGQKRILLLIGLGLLCQIAGVLIP